LPLPPPGGVFLRPSQVGELAKGLERLSSLVADLS
jgi:hypothetical protein